ncbi:hypothetical protein A5653_12555 [Mycobacterium colombiense]|uniref:hypothetical protein n=1 Tax=Mycobacterium colombiense TaxID=339268 RepID=UPI0007EF0029|nr:hypothetical protein [Mycobacterium colombiense]OBK69524.1 hypothetical protein A5653_12555 [Mycobacterium colombiense]
MSDSDIGDEIPATGLAAIAAYPHSNGYALALVGDDGTTHAFTLSGPRLRQVATVIVNCVQGIPSGSAAIIDQFDT